MQIRKWLALLVSAALALSLLAGCGGESVASALLKLLDGRYPNISIEIDPELEADLRQAIRKAEAENAGDDAAAIRAALETALGSTITFRYLGDGQKGDTAFDLVFYAGSDPDKAAQAAYSQWNLVFGSLPRDGQYSAGLAMVETNSGIWMLVKATVEKAGSRDDGPDDVVVKGTGFTYNVTKKTITVELDNEGMQELFFNNADTKVEAARSNGFEDIIITLKTGTYSVNDTFETPFKGTLQGESGATITLTGGSGLFAQIAGDGKAEKLNITVEGTISNDSEKGKAGAVAGVNNGTISDCKVTINGGGSISGDFAGGIAGWNKGTISSCQVEGSSIDGNPQIHGDKHAGGIASSNETSTSTIKGPCTVTGVFINASSSASIHAGGIVGSIKSGGSVSGTCTVKNCKINAQNTSDGVAYAGGIAGYNNSGSVSGGEVEDDTTVSAKCGAGGIASAGGIVGYNASLEGVGDNDIDKNCIITATAGSTTVSSDETSISGIGGEGDGDFMSGVFAGTKIGYQVN